MNCFFSKLTFFKWMQKTEVYLKNKNSELNNANFKPKSCFEAFVFNPTVRGVISERVWVKFPMSEEQKQLNKIQHLFSSWKTVQTRSWKMVPKLLPPPPYSIQRCVENAVFENQKRKFEIYVFSYKKWNTALFQRETTQHGLHARAIVVRVWFKLNRDENEVGVFFRKVGNRIIMVNNHFGEFQTPPKVLKKDHFGE